ncbi:MAG TPA: hypothetical protein VEO53_00875, partial [Candidatus Binatia bacterium]|nr:hypothetical protein [Candidatus Binatia bacterium]
MSATAYRVNPDGFLSPIGISGTNGVGPCDKIKIGARLVYLPFGFPGSIPAAFSGGTVTLCTFSG